MQDLAFTDAFFEKATVAPVKEDLEHVFSVCRERNKWEWPPVAGKINSDQGKVAEVSGVEQCRQSSSEHGWR